jgi:hypothetical protein
MILPSAILLILIQLTMDYPRALREDLLQRQTLWYQGGPILGIKKTRGGREEHPRTPIRRLEDVLQSLSTSEDFKWKSSTLVAELEALVNHGIRNRRGSSVAPKIMEPSPKQPTDSGKTSMDAHIQTVCSRLIRELNGRDMKNEACIGRRDTMCA